MIYEWLNTNMKYAGYVGVTDEYEEMLCWHDPIMGVPLPSIEDQEVPVVQQYLGEEDKERKPGIITDVVNSGFMHLISEAAKNALRDVWDKHATLYPVKLSDKPDELYYMVVVHTVIDCIDREKSMGSIEKFGKDKDKDYFSSINKWVMREDEVGDNFIFTLPDSEITIYLTERFKKRVIEAGLTGFGFVKQAFDDSPFIS